WAVGSAEAIWFLFSKPDQVLAGLAHLGELAVLLARANAGDARAWAQVATLVSHAAVAIHKALRGLRYADRLGASGRRRDVDASIAGDIVDRLKYALVAEILSWFVGIGEITAALRAAGVPEWVAGISRTLGRFGRLGR